MTRTLTIDGRTIGNGHPCYVIAEAGINHNGSLDTAKRLVDTAKAGGADAVKFQHRYLDQTYAGNGGEQGLEYLVPHLKKAHLSDDEFRELVVYCHEVGITFLCTPWDVVSADFLDEFVAAFKIGSPDLTNLPLVRHVAGKGKPIILSTGMATEDEIDEAVAVLWHHPFALLHCVSSYPPALEDLNLRYLSRMAQKWNCPLGWSGHDFGHEGFCSSAAAVALGACIVERHLTLSHGMDGPDHRMSLEPHEFATMVKGVRNIERALGDGVKRMTRGELLNRRNLGKSVVAARGIKRGEIIRPEDTAVRSPGLGWPPAKEKVLHGCPAVRDMAAGEMFNHPADSSYFVGRGPDQPISLPFRWGVVARFKDAERLAQRFLPLGMSLIEYHVSDKDLDAGLQGFRHRSEWGGVVVHAPEYMGEELVDLCSLFVERTNRSVARIQAAINLGRELGKHARCRPKVVFHVGGMTLAASERHNYLIMAIEILLKSLKQLDHEGAELLLENLPPFPWYFGGRWHGHVLTDPETVARVCRETGLGLCFDTSHAALWCNANGASLLGYSLCVGEHVKHLHVSDAAGVADEGLQIGDGTVDLSIIRGYINNRPHVTLVPEVWMGHHENGQGFYTALWRLEEMLAGKEVSHA